MIKLTDAEKTMIEKISEITLTDYGMVFLKEECYIHSDDLLSALEDMKDEYEHEVEEFEDFKQTLEDNYIIKPIDPYN